MLELRNVYKRFSGIPAVEDVSFSARAGEVTGYLDPNRSSKSTTMKSASRQPPRIDFQLSKKLSSRPDSSRHAGTKEWRDLRFKGLGPFPATLIYRF
jgi:ABC-type branched-subunit amino acid transport system ATPase component